MQHKNREKRESAMLMSRLETNLNPGLLDEWIRERIKRREVRLPVSQETDTAAKADAGGGVKKSQKRNIGKYGSREKVR